MRIKPTKENKASGGIADIVLNRLDKENSISFDEWSKSRHLAYYNEIMPFLISEGLVRQTSNGYAITYKGRLKVDNGGFVGIFNRERRALLWSCFAAIVSFVAAITSIIALVIAVR